MRQTTYTIIGIVTAVFLMMAIATELPKVPLAVLAVGTVGLALVMMRRKLHDDN